MTLEVLIATYKLAGIKRVARMNLPKLPGVSYLVCWQLSDGAPVPQEIQRDDIKVLFNDGIGISNNRNFGIEHSTADVLLFSDDDLEFNPDALIKILRTFENERELDIASFVCESIGSPHYPHERTILKTRLPKCYWVSSCEIAVRRSSLKNLRFNEHFGLGSGEFECGEEELFHLKARRQGLKCIFYPLTISLHNHHSTGTGTITDKAVIKGMGAVIAKSYPLTCFMRLPLKAVRMSRSKQASFLFSLKNLILGALKSLSIPI